MKKYTKVTNEFIELVRDSRHAVIEEGVGFAFNKEQVKEISKYLNKYFAKNVIMITEKDGIYTIALCNHVLPITKDIIEKARLLKQFCLNNEKNREILCSATNSNMLDRKYHDILMNW